MFDKFLSDPTSLGVSGLLALALFVVAREYIRERRAHMKVLEDEVVRLREKLNSEEQDHMETMNRLIAHAENATGHAERATNRLLGGKQGR